jgi:diacylglycerol O-acyltransferase / wax synthase
MGGNDIAFLAISLGADVADPVERLRVVRRSTAGAKEMQQAVGARELSELSASFPGALSSWGFKGARCDGTAFRQPPTNVQRRRLQCPGPAGAALHERCPR